MSKLIQNIIERITRQFNCSPQQINSGQCDQWIATTYEELADNGIDSSIWSTADWDEDYSHEDDHMFLQIGSKFYDAEARSGVKDFTLLPFYRRRFQKTGKFPPVIPLT